MPTTHSDRTKPTSRARARAAAKPAGASSAPRVGLREALITDPDALLAALARAGRAAEDVSKSQQAAQPRHTPALLACVPPSPEPLRLAPPPLREDERLGHAPNASVVVIIRRRRAA